MDTEKLTVYFDGACPLCSREIEHYQKRDTEKQLRYVDISSPSFDAAALGLDAKAVKKFIHVRLPDGRLVTGVDAFIEMWKVLPGFQTLGKIAAQPLVKPLLHVGYHIFAAIRPHLPKRHRKDCPESRCATS